MRNPRGGHVAFLLCVFLFAAPISSCSRSAPAGFPYDAEVVDLKDAPTTLASLRGHPVVFAAYAASMPDCRKRIEGLVALSDAFRNDEVRFVAVDVSPPDAGKFPKAVPEDRGYVLFLEDRYKEVTRAMKLDVIPTTFLVSSEGTIRERIEGVHTWDSSDFRQRVDVLVRSR